MDDRLYEWLLMVEDYLIKSKPIIQETPVPSTILEPQGVNSNNLSLAHPGGITMKNGKYYEGIGEFYVSNDYYFKGEMRDYKFWNGKGREVIRKNGDVYEGIWIDGKFHSGYRRMSFANGDFYNGSFRNNKRYNGRGRTTLSSLGVFVGEWLEGDFANGSIDVEYMNSNRLKGTIRNKMFYEGECNLSDRDISYQGSYKNGVRWNGIFKLGIYSYIISNSEIYFDENQILYNRRTYLRIQNYKFEHEIFKKK